MRGRRQLSPVIQDSEPKSTPPSNLIESLFPSRLSDHGTSTYNHHFRSIPQGIWALAKTPADQPLHVRQPVLPPPRIDALTTTGVVVLVLSHQAHHLERQAIRETWGKQKSNVLFVVAQSSSPETMEGDHALLREEQTRFQDLLEIPIPEDYNGLPEKLVQAYTWVMQYWPGKVHWIAKADDDMLVRVDSLEAFLIKYNPAVPMLIGNLVPYSNVQKEGRWEETDYTQQDHYPYWAKGSAGHVVSRAAAEYVVKHSESLHRFQGEDTSLGIWLHNANEKGRLKDLTYVHAEHAFSSQDVSQNIDTTDGEGSNRLPCFGNRLALMFGHNLKPNDLWACSQIPNPVHPPIAERVVWVGDSANFETQAKREKQIHDTTLQIRRMLTLRPNQSKL